jgi:formylmethanofuran dehydrogenase subunit E
MSVSPTLGMRAGHRVLKELGIGRTESKTALVQGGNFFAQGVEAVTGCSVLHGSMSFEEKPKSVADWTLRVNAPGQLVSIRMKDNPWQGANEVLTAADELLFESVEVSNYSESVTEGYRSNLPSATVPSARRPSNQPIRWAGK